MNNGNKLKRRVQLIILLPVVLALGLLGATIYLNGISSQMGVIAVALLIFVLHTASRAQLRAGGLLTGTGKDTEGTPS